MAITVEMMKAAAASGLSVVCASCERYWEARDKGLQGDVCLASAACGSPFAGGTFHEYQGPITKHVFKHNCFVCGDAAVKALAKPGSDRSIGICSKHFEWMNDPKMRKPQPVQLTTKPKKNFLDVDEATLKGHKLPPENSLLGEMLRTEKEWADADGNEFNPLSLMRVNGSNGPRS